MELDKDLVRDLLLELESKENNSSMSQQDINEFASSQAISIEKMLYTINRLKEADYINAEIKYGDNKPYWYRIFTITYQGHEFIDDIRDSKVWKVTKEKASQISGVSLTIIGQLARNYIKNQLGL